MTPLTPNPSLPQGGRGEVAPPDGVLGRIWQAVGDLFTNEVYVLASAIAFNALLSFFPFALLSAGVVKILALPLTFAVFFTLYFALPDRRIPARQAWPAAIFAGLLWEVSRIVCFWWAFPWLNFKETYGPFYISVTLVTWAFVSSMILLLGANLSAQNLLSAPRRGGRP